MRSLCVQVLLDIASLSEINCAQVENLPVYVCMYVCMYVWKTSIYMIFFINLESAAAVAIVVVEVRYKRKYKQVIG